MFTETSLLCPEVPSLFHRKECRSCCFLFQYEEMWFACKKKKKGNGRLINNQLFADKNDKTWPSKEEVLLLGAKTKFSI